MGPYGWIRAHIKTGWSHVAQDHFQTSPDQKMRMEGPNIPKESKMALRIRGALRLLSPPEYWIRWCDLQLPRSPPEGPCWAQARAQAGPKLGPSQKFEIQKTSKKQKFSKSKSVLPKMSARSGLVGKNPPGPIWGHLGPFFAWAGKIKKLQNFRQIFHGPNKNKR